MRLSPVDLIGRHSRCCNPAPLGCIRFPYLRNREKPPPELDCPRSQPLEGFVSTMRLRASMGIVKENRMFHIRQE